MLTSVFYLVFMTGTGIVSVSITRETQMELFIGASVGTGFAKSLENAVLLVNYEVSSIIIKRLHGMMTALLVIIIIIIIITVIPRLYSSLGTRASNRLHFFADMKVHMPE